MLALCVRSMDDPQAQQARTHQLPPLPEPSRGDHGPPSDAWSHVRFEGSMRFTRRRDRCSTHATQHTGLGPQRTRHHSRGVVELGFAPSRELLEGEDMSWVERRVVASFVHFGDYTIAITQRRFTTEYPSSYPPRAISPSNPPPHTKPALRTQGGSHPRV